MLVVATGVTQAPNDKEQVTPMLETLKAQAEVLGAVERLIALLSEYPYLQQSGLAYLSKYNDYPCPFPVTEDYSPRHLAEMFVSILALHGYEPDLITQHPTVLQVIQDWPAGCATPTRTASLTQWLPNFWPTRPCPPTRSPNCTSCACPPS
jgi:hypothetical protein